MNSIVDNQIVKKMAYEAFEIGDVHFRWPTLLEYLGMGNLFTRLTSFDPAACIESLSSFHHQDDIFHIYDQLFAEQLTQVKDLPEMDASYLLHAIQEKKKIAPQFLLKTLSEYESAFLHHPSHTMHDLILYLAWDRMCVRVSLLFNHQSIDPKFLEALKVVKDCLIESYLHIKAHGRTIPSLYRMLEALFFYQMRDEFLQKHSQEDWEILSQGFPILKKEEELADFFYIDDATDPNAKENRYLTLDTPELIEKRMAFAKLLNEQLKKQEESWNYSLLRPIPFNHS